ncbi:hypothetical protein J1C67_14540 [Clostridium gasigenes]|uniref:hypothetical protein n=1 Tax=Clostridium gasigenes TaxID=94869 RepID=UPI0014384AC6|nr:hypothetical protein [Clostridium gasigenes]NKF05301.1 hypothetical protein [Clostridium gasigenes]QSW18755.1 hypothetical protein J1C67_14540 [Clostridium gasigenes]
MAAGVGIQGMEDLTNLLENMTITTAEESRAMKNALEAPYKEALKNAPYLKGFTKSSIKKIVKKEEMAIVGKIRVNGWTGVFTEYGTSKDKSHVNWFGGSIDGTQNEFFQRLATELLKKAK